MAEKQPQPVFVVDPPAQQEQPSKSAAPKQDSAVAGAAGKVNSAQEQLDETRAKLAEAQAELASVRGEASAKAAEEARKQAERDAERATAGRVDETQPGGKFMVDGIYVDCDGKPLAQ